MLFKQLMKHFIRYGTLVVTDAGGQTASYGSGAPEVAIRLMDRRVGTELAINPRLAFGEAYMDGRLVIERGSLYDLLDLLTANEELGVPSFLTSLDKLAFLWRRVMQANDEHRSRKNVAHHYDLSSTLYDLFLDKDRQYSCAYFGEPGDSLETAQERKKHHIAGKLLLQPGQRVLDIGSGWGGLALTLAKTADVEVTGVTLSTEQLAVARQRAEAAGLSHRVKFELMDYRNVQGPFDRIVSVGMFEHVGVPNYQAFFAKVKDLLAPSGVALLHSIGRMDGPGTTNAWIRKYIFPGGYSPALSEVLPIVEKLKLWVTDVEVLRLHYAKTLEEWRRRFNANRAKVAQLYDERFCRMWDFYLAGSELAFRRSGHMVWQMQIAKDVAAVPLTRSYMYEPGHQQQQAESLAGAA